MRLPLAALALCALLLGCGDGSDSSGEIHLAVEQETLTIACGRADCRVGVATSEGAASVLVEALRGERFLVEGGIFPGVRRLRVATGAGSDVVYVRRLTELGLDAVTIDTGDGIDTIDLDESTVLDDLTLATGGGDDVIFTYTSGALGAVTVTTGDGADRVEMNQLGASPLAVDMGDGADSVQLFITSLHGTSRIATGAGDDVVQFETASYTFDLAVDGGSGSDTLDLAGSTIDGRFETTGFETESAALLE